MAKSNTSPTQRTMRQLRQQGAICAVVEKWNQHAGPFGVRQDLFGFVDVLVLDPSRGFIGIQCGAGSGHAAHRTKILENEIAPEWLKTGGRIEIWSWRKVKLTRGGKAERWQPRVEEITLADFGSTETGDGTEVGNKSGATGEGSEVNQGVPSARSREPQ